MSGNCPSSSEKDPVRLCRSIRDLFSGRSNASGDFTLSVNQATTTVDAPNCGSSSRVLLQAASANAAAEVGNGTIYVSAVGTGQFTVTHANSATTERVFFYRIAD